MAKMRNVGILRNSVQIYKSLRYFSKMQYNWSRNKSFLNLFVQVFPALNGLKTPGGLSFLHEPKDFPFNKDGETFVQPKVLKVLVRHQVSCPTVSNLVGYHASQTLVTSLTIKLKQKG